MVLASHRLQRFAIITTGPYSICRNPLYFFILGFLNRVHDETFTLGLALTFLDGLSVLNHEEDVLRRAST
jgi:protein-S-isoprenylcysteine O-methyltransferase Ste14